MNREEAVKVYLDGLFLKNVEIGMFFEAARSLSKEDKVRIQLAVERYATNKQDEKDDNHAEKNFQCKGGDKRKCLVL
ncbi:MAG: hypothetical protein HY096_01185 [Nitrospinae bacterium]|nr:hypothetical protein [Nitrospinota bacterium]MBI5748795.1 hypothetical protein [Nitrospinota bacterium]